MGYDILPPSPPPILAMTALSIALAALLIVTADLVESVERHGPANVAHPPIPHDLVSDRGGDIGEKGHHEGRCCGRHFSHCYHTYIG